MGSGCSRDEAPRSYFGLPLSALCELEVSRGIWDSYRLNVPSLVQELVLAAAKLPRESRNQELSMDAFRTHVDAVFAKSSRWKRGCRPFEELVAKTATSVSWVVQVLAMIFSALPEAVMPPHVCGELDHIMRSSLSRKQQKAAASKTLSTMSSLRLHAHEALVLTAQMLTMTQSDGRLSLAVAQQIVESWTRQHHNQLTHFVLEVLGVLPSAEPAAVNSIQAVPNGDTVLAAVPDTVRPTKLLATSAQGTKAGAAAPSSVPAESHRDPSVGTVGSEVDTQAQIVGEGERSSVLRDHPCEKSKVTNQAKPAEKQQAAVAASSFSAVSPGPSAGPASRERENEQALSDTHQFQGSSQKIVGASLPPVSKSQQLAQAKAVFTEDDRYSPREGECASAQPTVFCSQCSALRVEVDEIKLLLSDMTNALRQSHEELAALREQAQVTHHLVHGATATKPFRDRMQTAVAEVVQSQVLAAEDIMKLRKEQRELAEQIRFKSDDSERLAGEAMAARSASIDLLTKISDVERSLLANKQVLSEVEERCEMLQKGQTSLKEAVRSLTSDVEVLSHRHT
jgi:hypothetical protein